ncbi:hypothetical protein MGYG_00526 [Nannizzia gypsea CBS 118893]|uniref:DUF7136 domain-containing protein n=1 Tax=Arthroderma gypseum (strain ATCC MYA-4604 / CBS 118893) TaxID=535722 RepID=E5R075_ARTGP|nr:hypothetical protein MGYG_00526 [Nannizzia gypsea CBS 118893]EFQ97486.1 hypothetical protein MGYG_00526 [Nannizzia gypsea CBS 118893]
MLLLNTFIFLSIFLLRSLPSLARGFDFEEDLFPNYPFNEKVLDGIEVSLIFPRGNETYAPTAYFPIVMAVRNPEITFPLGLRLGAKVSHRDSFNSDLFYFPNDSSTTGSFPPTSPYYFAINGTDLINRFTGSFTVKWRFRVHNICRDLGEHCPIIEQHYSSQTFSVDFSISPDAPLPNIEEAVNRCSNSTAWLKPFGIQESTNCPLIKNFSSPLPPMPDPCLVKPFAKDLAANVSKTILGLLDCPDGAWQTIKEPCRKKSSASRGKSGFKVVWLLLAAVISVWAVL